MAASVKRQISQLLAIIGGAGFLACGQPGGDRDPQGPGLFKVAACGQSFFVRIDDPEIAQQAAAQIGQADQLVLTGHVMPGDGGFNSPWAWHLDPADISFSEVTIELCDGCPQTIEEDPDGWIRTVGVYCPWDGRIVQYWGD